MMSGHRLERLAVRKAADGSFHAGVVCKTSSCTGEGKSEVSQSMSSAQLAVCSPVSDRLEVNEGWFMVLGIHESWLSCCHLNVYPEKSVCPKD